MKHPPIVYAITNGAGALYIGMTTNMQARLRQHNGRFGAAFTKEHAGHWREVYRQVVANEAEGRCIEAWWSNWLNDVGPLPFLTFKPSAWQREHHDHKRRHQEKNKPRAETQAAAWRRQMDDDAKARAAAERARHRPLCRCEVIAVLLTQGVTTSKEEAARLGVVSTAVEYTRAGYVNSRIAPMLPRRVPLDRNRKRQVAPLKTTPKAS